VSPLPFADPLSIGEAPHHFESHPLIRSLVDKSEMSFIPGMIWWPWTIHCGFNHSGEALYRDVQISLFLARKNNPNTGVRKSICANGEATLETPVMTVAPVSQARNPIDQQQRWAPKTVSSHDSGVPGPGCRERSRKRRLALASFHPRRDSGAATDGGAGRNDGILTKNLSFRVHVGGVGVGLKSHNLMASFF
jgi:hypothetical protein